MSRQWNDAVFNRFVQLREALRAAKRAGNHREVLSFGAQIVELDKAAGFLNIALGTFLRDMAMLSDLAAAERYFPAAKAAFVKRSVGPDSWQHDIEVIDRRLERLRVSKSSADKR